MKWRDRIFGRKPDPSLPAKFSFTHPERTRFDLAISFVVIGFVLLITVGTARSLLQPEGRDLFGFLVLGCCLLVLGMLTGPLGRQTEMCHSVRVENSTLNAAGLRLSRTIPVNSVREIGRLSQPTRLHARVLLSGHAGMAQLLRILSEQHPEIDVSMRMPKRDDSTRGLELG